MASMSMRDPYPFPQYENDDKYVGHRGTMKPPYTQPTHLAQKGEPWSRLYNTGTLSSTRREVYHCDPLAPRDSLDFVLKTEYNHHQEFLKGTNETLVQPETLGNDHGRILKNREYKIPPKEQDLGHPLNITSSVKNENINSINTVIDGPHGQTSKRGYSRKPDGGFFTT